LAGRLPADGVRSRRRLQPAGGGEGVGLLVVGGFLGVGEQVE